MPLQQLALERFARHTTSESSEERITDLPQTVNQKPEYVFFARSRVTRNPTEFKRTFRV